MVITWINITVFKESEVQLVRAKEMLEQGVQERIHELDGANQKIRQTHSMFQALFNANPIPAALTRFADNVILDVNTEFLAYFSLEREQIIGRSLAYLNLGLDLEGEIQKRLTNLLNSEGRLRGIEVEIQHPSGEKGHILTSIQYLNWKAAIYLSPRSSISPSGCAPNNRSGPWRLS